MSLPDAIRAAVESQGVPWRDRTRIATPNELADELHHALAHVPDVASDRSFVAALIGECAQESDWYCATAEYGGPRSRYAPWYGRGLIQLTWQANYQGCTEWLRGIGVDADLVADPDRAQAPIIRWLTAIYYFARHIPAHYWQDGDWDSISGLINGGSASFRGPSFPARAAACRAAYDHITDDDLGDDMPSADEIARAILDTAVTRQGLPDTDTRAGQPVTIRAIFEWLDATHSAIPGDTVQRLLDTEVPRHGLPDTDPSTSGRFSRGRTPAPRRLPTLSRKPSWPTTKTRLPPLRRSMSTSCRRARPAVRSRKPPASRGSSFASSTLAPTGAT